MDVRRLRYFVAVASERSFTRAAQRLNMAQPPLSKRIQEIEDELGAQLIDRSIRPLQLTAAGALFYEQSLQVLHRLEQLSATMKEHIEAGRPRLTIGLIASLFHERLPQFIRRYRTRAPDIEIVLTEMGGAAQVKALQEGRIDVGLGRRRIDGVGVRSDVLRNEPVLAVLPSQGAGRWTSGTISLEMMQRFPLILYPQDAPQGFGAFMLSLFRESGITPSRTMEVGDMQTALVMAASGAGASLIPASARRLVHSDAVCLPLAPAVFSPVVLMRRSEDVSFPVRLLIQTIRDLYPEWGHPAPSGLLDTAGGVEAPPYRQT
ncbi:LysR family transcriptional regulator [Novosphingobium sp. 9]|uniref:LysR family transcriptional regulator n=1 Tax=Novosphingobium sp. 9 TaxID=2025349 RepID=UPI0021B654A5|nr:LysR family transcriptional regulator [Novosphingobium sp. 9]